MHDQYVGPYETRFRTERRARIPDRESGGFIMSEDPGRTRIIRIQRLDTYVCTRVGCIYHISVTHVDAYMVYGVPEEDQITGFEFASGNVSAISILRGGGVWQADP